MQFIGQEWLCWDRPLNFLEVSATPSTPFADKLKLYAKDKAGVSNLYFLDDAGVEHDLAPSIIGGSGAAGQVAYWTATSTLSGEAALQYDEANDRLGVGGTAAPDFPFHLSIDNAGSTVQPVIDKFGANAGPLLTGRAAKGSRASPTQMVVNDLLFGIAGQGRHNGGAWSSNNPAAIRFKAAETFTTIAQGTYISLETTPVGSTTPAERFRVGPSGELGIGGATYGSAGNLFRSGGASAAPTWLDHTTDFLSQYALLAGRSGGQTLKGGTAVTDFLSFQSTTGIGTTDYIKFLVGNNGATEAMRILNNGNVQLMAGANSILPSSDNNGNLGLSGTRWGNIYGVKFVSDSFLLTGGGGVGNGSTPSGISGTFIMMDSGANIMDFYTSNTRVFRLTNTGNLCMATTDGPTNGRGGIVFGDNTALSSMAANTAGLYADDIAGNVSMHAINENGDVIKLIKTGTYTPTNVGANRSYDADSTTVDELADVLGTLIADLQLTGLLG